MKRFGREDLLAFLQAVERHAPEEARAVIIGGAAAALSFGAPGGTVDIDTANNVAALDRACLAARKDTGPESPWASPPSSMRPRNTRAGSSASAFRDCGIFGSSSRRSTTGR